MALPKKRYRKISVNDKQYYWIASGNDGHIDLIIVSGETSFQKLFAQFDYKSDFISKTVRQFVITPKIVRQVIIYGLKNGWVPEQKGTDLNLGFIDGEITE